MKIEINAEKISRVLERNCGIQENFTPQQLHTAVAEIVMDGLSSAWEESRRRHDSSRKASYLSMEYLVGRAVGNALLCTEALEDTEKAFTELGQDFSCFEDIEDAALGNGGLGRLAACFLDSAAAMSLPLDGYGIRYRYGLFRQTIEDGFQLETADDWQRFGDPWSIRRDSETVRVHFADLEVNAVPYDYAVPGYCCDNVGTLRLWQAEAADGFDFALFNSGSFGAASDNARRAEDISRVLYPNDETEDGKRLRLRQEYFFSAASVADLVRKHRRIFGSTDSFAEYNSIQLNDTHPVIAVPELIRVLMKEDGQCFEKAFETARRVFNYTNHTIMAEALECWDSKLIEELLPEVYGVIIMINERLRSEIIASDCGRKLSIIENGRVKMADLAVYVSGKVNGVAELHTELLKREVLKDWYAVYPERFLNKTNGITQRRWIALCNRELSALITELLGSKEWISGLDRLRGLEKYADDDKVLERFAEIKREKKRQLAEHILKNEGISLDPTMLFDIQIKRLHEYKRQLMNALSILYIYYGLKDGSISLESFYPMAFIFGAKAAPGYRRAKGIIKLINEIGRLISEDEEIRGLIKVVFVRNYRVSYAEKLIPAADISEQISTAGTEASGTGNMKLMLNGAVTLGTLDGANIEIVREAGRENNYIFGATEEELAGILPCHSPRVLMEKQPEIKRVLNSLIDGTLDDGGTGLFRELYFSLLDGASYHQADNYYVIGDLPSYVEAKLRANADYRSGRVFTRKCWLNMCGAGHFSSDRTIAEYAEEIWDIKRGS